jgi:hypothetical protein
MMRGWSAAAVESCALEHQGVTVALLPHRLGTGDRIASTTISRCGFSSCLQRRFPLVPLPHLLPVAVTSSGGCLLWGQHSQAQRLSSSTKDYGHAKRVILYEQQWDAMLGKLKTFRKEHGHSRVPRGWATDPKLASWVSTQRKAKNRLDRGDLKPGITRQRVSRLDEIGFDWGATRSVDNESRWNAMLDLLKAFKNKHGCCNVLDSWEEDSKLANWVSFQRKAKARLEQGKTKPGITAERVKALDALGFEWTPHAVRWEAMIAALHSFKEDHGHCNVPYGWEANRTLANWVANQRRRKRLLDRGEQNPGITAERVSRLDELGLEWSRRDKHRTT